MNYFSLQSNANNDGFIKIEHDLPEFSSFGQSSQQKNMQNIQEKTQAPKKQSIQVSQSLDKPKLMQSDLHNCPKHLIKIIINCLGLKKKTSQQVSKQFIDCKNSVYENIKGLLYILQMIRKNKITSFSKQLLKIVFQNNSQNIYRLKLLQNPFIKKVFQKVNTVDMCQAKERLRQRVINELQNQQHIYNDRSKQIKKQINDRYLGLFLQELKLGKIKQRISKEDKLRILDEQSL